MPGRPRKSTLAAKIGHVNFRVHGNDSVADNDRFCKYARAASLPVGVTRSKQHSQISLLANINIGVYRIKTVNL